MFETLDKFLKTKGTPQSIKSDVDKCNKAMLQPPFLQELLKKSIEGETLGDPETEETIKSLEKVYVENYLSLFPSVFKLISNMKKSGKDFAILLHTFTNDASKMTTELNHYFKGSHPLYSGKNGTSQFKLRSEKGKFADFEDLSTARIFRFSSEKNDAYFALGARLPAESAKTFKEKIKKVDVSDDKQALQTTNSHVKKNDIRNEIRNLDHDHFFEHSETKAIVKVYKTFDDIFIAQSESLKQNMAMIVHQDFSFWNSSKSSKNGKIVFTDSSEQNVLQLFFDDRITEDEESIVSFWDISDKAFIPPEKLFNSNCFKVDPVEAMRDPDYFIKLVNKAIETKKKNEELLKTEKEEALLNEINRKREAWNELQSCPTSEYLRRTIMPLLLPALELVEEQRPSDPLVFIAEFMMKNRELLDLPKPVDDHVQHSE